MLCMLGGPQLRLKLLFDISCHTAAPLAVVQGTLLDASHPDTTMVLGVAKRLIAVLGQLCCTAFICMCSGL
jgi:hypothetical protein